MSTKHKNVIREAVEVKVDERQLMQEMKKMFNLAVEKLRTFLQNQLKAYIKAFGCSERQGRFFS